MIDTTPATTSIEIKDAKPSDILKSMPREKWGRSQYFNRFSKKYCALGELGRCSGHDLRECPNGPMMDDIMALQASMETDYGLGSRERLNVIRLNDEEGLDAVIRYLESIGK